MRIAIVRRNGLGDLLAVMPLVYLCKEKYPHCHVTLFVDPRNAPLLPYLRGFDEAVILEPARNKYVSLMKTLWKNRGHTFDLVISGKPAPMQWVDLFLAGLKSSRKRAVVRGGVKGDWHACWINEPLAWESDLQLHQMVKSLRLLDPSFEEVPDRLLPKIGVRGKCPTLFGSTGAAQIKKQYSFGKKTILISVTNHRIGSQLDSDKIALHLNRTLKDIPIEVIVNCEPKDQTRAQSVAQLLQVPYQIISTEDFDDFMTLLASVDASWTGDGGIMHLMAAFDKPQLVLFGKTPLWEWAPLSKKAICIWHPENVNLIPSDKIDDGLKRLVHELR